MAFTVKDWQDSPSTSTPLSAAALEDMEARLAGYTDTGDASARKWFPVPTGGDDAADLISRLNAGETAISLRSLNYSFTQKVPLVDGALIRGAGREKTTITIANGASIADGLFKGTNAQGVEICDLTINCNKANTTDLTSDTQQQGIYFLTTSATGSKRCAVRRVLIKNGLRMGLHVRSNDATWDSECILEDVEVIDCGRAGVFIHRPSLAQITGLTLRRNGVLSGSTMQQFYAAEGKGVNADRIVALDGGRSGIVMYKMTRWQLNSPRCTRNGVSTTDSITGIGLAISEDCRDWSIDNPQCHDNQTTNIQIDPRVAGSPVLKDVEGTINGGVVSGSVAGHGAYTQYSRGVRWNGLVTRGNFDDGFKLVSCEDVEAYVTSLDNTSFGVSITDGTGTGSGPGGKNWVYAHVRGNAGGTLEDLATTKSDVWVTATAIAQPFRAVIERQCRADAVTASTRLLLTGASGPVAASASNGAAAAFYLDPLYFTKNGLTPKLRLRFSLATNATAPVSDFTLSLKPFTTPTGGAAQVGGAAGTDVSGSTAVVTAPALGTLSQTNSGVFDCPAAGWYCIALVNSATMAASSAVQINAVLEAQT